MVPAALLSWQAGPADGWLWIDTLQSVPWVSGVVKRHGPLAVMARSSVAEPAVRRRTRPGPAKPATVPPTVQHCSKPSLKIIGTVCAAAGGMGTAARSAQ